MAISRSTQASDESLISKVHHILERECPRKLVGPAHEEFYIHFKGRKVYCVDRWLGEKELSGFMALSPGQRLLIDMKES